MRWSSVIPILLAIQLVIGDPLDKAENDQRLNSCGKTMQSKVYQGRVAQPSEAPWSVFFLSTSPPNEKGEMHSTICTGTVISPRHILFATHCFADQDSPSAAWQIKEGQDLDKSNCKDKDYVITDNSILERIRIESNKKTVAESPEKLTIVNGCLKRVADKTRKYGNLNSQFFVDDFAIIDLYEDLNFSNTLQTVCVAKDTTANKDSTTLDYYGYGLDPPSGKNTSDITGKEDNSGTLRHETIKVNSTHPMEDYFFLANNEKKNTVACVGDSGGGAIATIDGKKTIVGVLSQTNCAVADKRGDPKEQYASVGYYNERICQLTGVCNTVQEHEKMHPNYVKQEKPPRPTKVPVSQNTAGGVQVQRPVGEPDSTNAKSYFITIVLGFVAFMIQFDKIFFLPQLFPTVCIVDRSIVKLKIRRSRTLRIEKLLHRRVLHVQRHRKKPTDREKKEKKEKVAPVKKKKAEPVIPEKKLDRTQEDEKETESGLSLVVKEASVPVKMDDGYEDFGPGANNP